jgi:small subunit ribosomal protein S20
MPLIKSAKKKMRKDKLRTERNKDKKINLKGLIKKARLEKGADSLKAVFSALDKATKTNLIHKKKADRLKSRLSKGSSAATNASSSTKKASKKKVVKKAK